MRTLNQFMSTASTKEQERLALLAKTSRGHLYHISCGNRDASADLARRLEHASRKLNASNPALPIIYRGDLCAACGKCEFARRD